MLGVLAGLTPPDVEVVLYDDRMEGIPYDEQTDLVAITVETYTARRSYEIASEYRQRGVWQTTQQPPRDTRAYPASLRFSRFGQAGSLRRSSLRIHDLGSGRTRMPPFDSRLSRDVNSLGLSPEEPLAPAVAACPGHPALETWSRPA